MSIHSRPERPPGVHTGSTLEEETGDVPQLLEQSYDNSGRRGIRRATGGGRAPLPDRPSTRTGSVQHRGDPIMTAIQTETPGVASRHDWLTARKALLQQEKELTYRREGVAQARRQLPRVRMEKDYTFDSTSGPVGLADLFHGRSQLIVYH